MRKVLPNLNHTKELENICHDFFLEPGNRHASEIVESKPEKLFTHSMILFREHNKNWRKKSFKMAVVHPECSVGSVEGKIDLSKSLSIH